MPLNNNKEFRRNSFEPKLGLVQLVFGLIYAFITGIAIVLAVKVYEADPNHQPWLQYAFVLLFAAMAAKSFFLYARAKILFNTGKHVAGKVESISSDHGITFVRGSVKLADGSMLPIESRFAGVSVAKEIERFLEQSKSKMLPALVVSENTKHPRGMFLIKTKAGHLDPDYINSLKTDK